jgi:hypothetical protein
LSSREESVNASKERSRDPIKFVKRNPSIMAFKSEEERYSYLIQSVIHTKDFDLLFLLDLLAKVNINN